MADDTLRQVQQLKEGGVWTTDTLLGDESWVGEASTRKDKKAVQESVIFPKTPVQEDRETITSILGNPEFIAALTREVERKMLRDSGRTTTPSLLHQMSVEREDAVIKVKDWIIAQQATQSVTLSSESKDVSSHVKRLEEKVITLEHKINELMNASITQSGQEKAMIEEAYRIIQEKRQEDVGSNQTPSEIERLEKRTVELDKQIDKFKSQVAPEAGQQTRSIAAKNKKKFGSLF